MRYNFRSEGSRLPSFLVALTLMAVIITGCGTATGTGKPTRVSYYDGDLTTAVATSSGPLRLEVVRVTYVAGSSKQSGGTSYNQVPETTVSLRLTNSGDSPVSLPGLSGSAISVPNGGTPPVPPAAYYLMDGQGHRFNATGSGLTLWNGQRWDGKVRPGQTVEFELSYDPIPTTSKKLTLVLEGLKSDSGREYTLREAIPVLSSTAGRS